MKIDEISKYNAPFLKNVPSNNVFMPQMTGMDPA